MTDAEWVLGFLVPMAMLVACCIALAMLAEE